MKWFTTRRGRVAGLLLGDRWAKRKVSKTERRRAKRQVRRAMERM